MPRRYCGSCRSPLHADDGHSECVSCLGKSHADAALAGSDCSHCESISLASLRTRIAFFSESDPAPRALPFSSSQGPVRKKQRGRGSQRPVDSELTLAQIPRASLSPHREMSPVLFIQPDQRPSVSVSDLVSFGGSDDELADDSMSLVASDAEELFLGTVLDSAHMRAVITPERALAIQKLAATFKSDTARPLQVFQRMLGLMAAASPVLQLGLLRMRPLQRWLKPRVPHNTWRYGRLHIRVISSLSCERNNMAPSNG